MTPERLRALFHPRSIALVGATDASRWSITIYQNLKNFGYSGPIYCVHPTHPIVHGQAAVKRLSDINEPVDLAFIMVSTQRVFSILEEVAALSIPNVVILTSGFSETGSKGQELEHQILAFVQQHDITMLGPNGNGFVNVSTHILPYGLPVQSPLVKGPVGIVLQSGALASAVITLAQARHVGLSLLVSMGNETQIAATDVMDYLIEDEETHVIAVFLESIRQPAQFARIAQKALARKKPIIALKVGKSEISARAAKAHTGALVGSDAINDAVFKQLGIIRVDSLEDLLITAEVLGYSKPITGRRMGLVTPSGGACDILADRSHEEHILLPDFARETVQGLQHLLPEFSTIHNPLDVTGYIVIDRTLQQRTLEVVVHDPGLDFLVYLSEPPRVEPPAELLPVYLQTYTAIGNLIRQSHLPIVILANTSIDLTPFGQYLSDRAGIHFVGGMEHGMTAIGNAIWWHERYQQFVTRSQEAQTPLPAIQLPVSPAGTWPEYVARDFLQAHGVSVVPARLASNAEEAVQAARAVGFPVALKIQAADILHKSDVGGVALHVASEDEVRTQFHAMLERVRANTASQAIDGVLVSPMRLSGIELLVGIIADPVWGQVLAIGLGGIWTEIFKDTSVRVLPIARDEVKHMVFELRGAPLLQGVRGQPVVDIEALTESIFRITVIAQQLQHRLESLEINPLLISEQGIEALDVLMTWRQENT